MAVDDAYNAREYREMEGDDEIAWRIERISRRTCRAVAEFSFQQARRMHATVFGGPKWTVSPVYEGMLKEELDAAAARHPDVRYKPLLIDALYAALISHSGDALVVPALNRDGDCLSDMVLQLFGSIAGAESQLLAFDDEFRASAVMAEAPHGTAPTLQGKNVANPLAMILAAASVLPYMGGVHAPVVSRAIYESALEAIGDDIRTADLGGALRHRRLHRRGHQARPHQARRLVGPRGERSPLLSHGFPVRGHGVSLPAHHDAHREAPMSRPPHGLAFVATSLGLLLVASAAGLQIAVVETALEDGSGVDRGATFATYVLNGLGTAGAFLLALGILIALWGVYSSRDEA